MGLGKVLFKVNLLVFFIHPLQLGVWIIEINAPAKVIHFQRRISFEDFGIGAYWYLEVGESLCYLGVRNLGTVKIKHFMVPESEKASK